MLTMRQIDVVTYLFSAGDWVTGSRLSSHFKLDKKTLAGEIRAIELALEGCRIESGRRGFRIGSLSDDARRQIYSDARSYGGFGGAELRPAAIFVYLMFREDYVSMQQLADAFYMSKTAVSIDLDTVKRWIDSSRDVRLEVSNTKGIRVLAPEERKRFCCARFGSRYAFRLALTESGAEEGFRLLDMAEEILLDVLAEERLELTGEAFRVISGYLAVAVLRSRLGFCREDAGETPGKTHSAARLAARLLKEREGYVLTRAEVGDLSELLCRSGAPGGAREQVPDETWRALERIERHICRILDLPESPFGPVREDAARQLDRLIRLQREGSIPLEREDRDVTAGFPLETYLMTRLLKEHAQLEGGGNLSAMALFLATGLARWRDSVSVLIASYQDRSVTARIETVLRGFTCPPVREVWVMPVYAMKHGCGIAADYDILLTTEREIIMAEPRFRYVPSVIGCRDGLELDRYVKQKSAELRVRRMRELLRRCMVRTQGGAGSLDEILGPGPEPDEGAFIVGGRLLICRIADGAEQKIEAVALSKPLTYDRRKIKEILRVSCPEGSRESIFLFEAAAAYLKDEISL